MDIARPDLARKKRLRRLAYGAVMVVAVPAITIALSRLKPAAPVVEHSAVWVDTVRRGEMLRDVRGIGTLVPVDVRWIPAQSSARVDKIVLQSGAAVKPDSIILELSDPQLQLDALEAEYAYKAGQADLANLKVQLSNSLMAQKSTAADIESEYQQAKMQAEVDKQLSEEGIQAALTAKKSAVVAEQLAIKEELVQEQLKIADDAAKAQVAAQQAHLEQQRVLYELKERQLDALHVRAGLNGVLSAVSVEVGQQVALGTNLIRVADPSHLKATVQIPETQAKDLSIGQKATIDTHNGTAEGRVSRVDAAVVNGTVAVDVSFDGPLPPGARPDLGVDGTIEIERLPNVLYVGRPVQGQPHSTIGLFKVLAGSTEAVRAKVELGRISVNTVEVLHGLQAGDQVILSDVSAWDSYDRIRLE
ncbi:MAG TPA: HlyD family efflux transporter periplasmic adaptor subunit [Bryobacteraceae bacterium]|nr:HlyD family efflux transporter periplasmic adaptor subunit [Bryobacteraceae bacterium]